jgi:hypothetical protein
MAAWHKGELGQQGLLVRWAFFDSAERYENATRPWTEDELKRAREMRAAGNSSEVIDRVLRRRAGSTKLQLEGVDHRHNVRAIRVPDNILAEREALTTARKQRALTQDFFGYPPPGYSALHVRRGRDDSGGVLDDARCAKWQQVSPHADMGAPRLVK